VRAYLDQRPEASATGAVPNLGSFAQRSFPPDEFEESKGMLKLDTDWYLTQQIHPPTSRLCEPIEVRLRFLFDSTCLSHAMVGIAGNGSVSTCRVSRPGPVKVPKFVCAILRSSGRRG
jgi:hypothetical protein